MKKVLLHGVIAGALTSIASVIYSIAYSEALLVDFSEIINPASIIGACLFACLLASLGYLLLSKYLKSNLDVWFNIIFLIISFASFYSPFSVSLPLTINSPELFPGLAIPMHLFPVLFWIASKPLIFKSKGVNS